MTAKHYNLARMFTPTTGTGTLTLGAAATGFLSFAAAGISDGDTITYAIEDGDNREIGHGVYAASAGTLTRSVLASTNGDAAISLSGTAQVYITLASEDLAVANLNDVDVSSAPTDGQLLKWSVSAGKWVPASVSAVAATTPVGVPSLPVAGSLQLYALYLATPNAVWDVMTPLIVKTSTVYDGHPGTRTVTYFNDGWLTNNVATGWITFQFPTAILLDHYTIVGWSLDTFPNRCPKDWTLQGSNDGTTWTTIDTRTNETTWTQWATNLYSVTGAAAYSYYKIDVTANNGDSYMGISAVRFYTAAGDATLLYSASASSTLSATSTPLLAPFYVKATSGWLSNGSSTGWLEVKLPAPVVITQYALMGWSLDTFPNRCPKDWTLQGSNDGTTWTTIDTRTNETTWTQWATNLYSVTGAAAYSYYKIDVTANNGDSYMGISQWKLYTSTIIPGNPPVIYTLDEYGCSTPISAIS